MRGSKEGEFSARALIRTFDVVGATDRYEEFLLMLSDVVGLRHPQYTVRSAPAPRAMRSHAHRTCHAACASSCVPHWCRPGLRQCRSRIRYNPV